MNSTTIVRREEKSTDLAGVENLHSLLKKIYQSRGIGKIEELERDLKQLLPYNDLSNISAAVDTLYSALKLREKIIIVGDFDADGATSTTLAVTCLQKFGAEDVSYIVPNRFEFGYGLTPEIVDVAAEQQPDLIITVDNGISSINGVARANDLNIKVLVTDHHLPGNELPAATAIVNPSLVGDQFASKNLAGVGVIFYVMLALRARLREENWFAQQNIPEPNMASFLDLVALGTVADVVTLDQNNRILVHQGLSRIRQGKCRPGIQALLNVTTRNQASLTASDLGFALGPRLNAAGRLDDMSVGIECLLTKDENYGQQLAAQLDALNKERKVIESDMQEKAFAILNKLTLSEDLPMGVCVYGADWHQGVVGIVASRIKDKLHRPVIAFAKTGDGELKGSARSVAGVHIRDVLDAIATKQPELMSKFGGHAMAAGLSLLEKNFQDFSDAFANEIAQHLTSEQLQGKIYSDGELLPEYFNMDIAQLLNDSGPWGQGFPEPIFDNEFIIVEQRIVGTNHLKLVLGLEGKDVRLDAIAFNIDPKQWPNHHCEKIKAAYKLDINEFRGRKTVQLLIEYLQAV